MQAKTGWFLNGSDFSPPSVKTAWAQHFHKMRLLGRPNSSSRVGDGSGCIRGYRLSSHCEVASSAQSGLAIASAAMAAATVLMIIVGGLLRSLDFISAWV